MAHERHSQEHGLEAELLQPTLVAQQRGAQSQLAEAAGFAVDQRRHPEFLGEAPELADGCRLLIEIDEVDFDAALGKEPQCRAGVRAFAHAKDLDLHVG